jgi:hypothetical protein
MNFKNVLFIKIEMVLIQSILVLEPGLIGQNDFKKNQSIRIWYQKYRLLFKKDKLRSSYKDNMRVPRGLKI